MNGVTQLQSADYEDYFRLSEFAFQYELTDEERKKSVEKINPEHYWGYYTEGKLAAKLKMLPLSIWIEGKQFSMGGIASVSTWPEFRRNGYVGQLLHHCFRVMKDRGQTISMLHPFAFPFYRKFGYETYVERKQYEIKTEQLPRDRETRGRIERTDNVNLLNEIYEKYAKRYNGMLIRTNEWWKDNVLTGRMMNAVWFSDGDEPLGYVCYQVKNNVMTIHELAHLNESARQGLIAFVANHDSMMEKVTWTAPSDDEYVFLLPDPRVKQEIHPYFMARIVDAVGFLRQYPFRSGKAIELLLHIEDQEAEWNSGSYRLSIDEYGSAEVEHQEWEVNLVNFDPNALSCSIQTLAAMFFGYKTPSFLHAVGRVTGEAEAVYTLESRLSKRTTYLADFF